MHYFRLVLVLILAWFSWQSWVSPTTADGPGAALPEETTPLQLVIPSIDLNTPVEPVGIGTIVINGQKFLIWNTAENYVGWHQDSGPPGQKGNTVLAGHSNGGSEIFRHLEVLEVGEDIFLATNKGWHKYRVSEKLILREQGEPAEVRAANARWILPTEDERLTLITCWPYPSNTHRLLIIAYPISREAPPNPMIESQPDSTASHGAYVPKPSSRYHNPPSTSKTTTFVAQRANSRLQRLMRVFELNNVEK